jgi:hypothetical protein
MITFQLLDLEEDYDYVTVWTCLDSECRNMIQTAQFTGTRDGITEVFVYGPAAYVQFTSDGFVTGKFGFTWEFYNYAVSLSVLYIWILTP